jgi:hypothetical protein
MLKWNLVCHLNITDRKKTGMKPHQNSRCRTAASSYLGIELSLLPSLFAHDDWFMMAGWI